MHSQARNRIKIRMFCLLLASYFLSSFLVNFSTATEFTVSETVHKQELTRRPVAIVALNDNVIVANQRTGTLSLIAADTHQVKGEYKVADQVLDAARSQPAGEILAIVERNSQRELVSVAVLDDGVSVRTLCILPMGSWRLEVHESDQPVVYVASRWARSVTRIELTAKNATVKSQQTIDMKYPAGKMLLVPTSSGQALLVASAFGGQLGVVAPDQARLLHVHKLPFHNMRGLAYKPKSKTVYIAHQQLNSRTWAEFDDVHWGILMQNAMHGLQLNDVLTASSAPITTAWEERLGLVGHGTGDPGEIEIDSKGRVAIALTGVHEVKVKGASFAQPFATGRGPTALLSLHDKLYVANRFDDTVTVIGLVNGDRQGAIRLGPQASLTSVDRGEQLFFDATLSHDRWMSCHSCHAEGHTIDRLADTLGDGDYGAPKRIPSLLGTVSSAPWAWDGSQTSLPAQIKKSVKTTMHGGTLSSEKARDIAAFLEQLRSPPPAESAAAALVGRGRAVFTKAGCVNCHTPPSYTSRDTFDVGLKDEQGRQQFNPPSLLGVGQRDSYFHDGSAGSLDEVIHKIKHQQDSKPLSRKERDALVAFLRSL